MGGKKSLMKLKKFLVKLKWTMKLLQPIRTAPSDDDLEGILGRGEAALVPKGHFALLAGEAEEEEEEKFVVDLKFLRSPALLRLLKDAEEEYGFQQEGALVVPCKPHVLKRIFLENM